MASTELMVADKLNIIWIKNPFDPRVHTRDAWQLDAPKTLRELFPTCMQEHVVSINGKIVVDENFDKHYVQPGDSLVVCPIPTGGGGGKSILRLVAMIAVAIYAPQLAPQLYSALGGTFVSLAAPTTIAAIQAGIVVAGAMVVNGLLPNKASMNDIGTEGLDSSPSYGIDGQKNTAVEGIPVPVVYGTFRMGGNFIQLYTENVGATQYLYALLCAGEGPIEAITDIELNDQPLSNFSDIETPQVRLGLPSQELIPWFDDIITPRNVSTRMTTDWSMFTTVGKVDKLRFDIAFPAGLSSLDSQGNRQSHTVDVEIQVRPVGGVTWTSVGDADTITGYTAPVGSYYVYGPPPNYHPDSYQPPAVVIGYNVRPIDPGHVLEGYGDPGVLTGYITTTTGSGDAGYTTTVWGTWRIEPIYQTLIRFTDRIGSTLRRSVTTGLLNEDFYEVRYRRTTAESTSDTVFDDVFMTDINEISVEDIAYVNTALLGLKIKLTDQLNSIPRVTFQVRGRQIRVFNPNTQVWEVRGSRNPAWIVLDMLTHPRYGAGMSDDRIDIEKFREWAQFCDAEGLTYDGVFDTSMNIWEAINYVCRAGHAAPLPIGTRFTVAIERPSTPVMMFSVANIVEGTFSQSWLPMADRANEIEVNYFDKDAKYTQKTIRVIDQQALEASNEIRSSSVTLYGVTDIQRAYKEGRLLLNMNRYILQSVEFEAPPESLACTVGDLVYVQHDMPQWGYAGRCEAGSTTTVVNLDRVVPFDGATPHKLLVLFDAMLVHSGVAGSLIGDTLPIVGVTANMSIKRIKVGSYDLEVLAVNSGSVRLASVPPGFNVAGQTVQCWDTDYIAERDVIGVAGGTIVTLSAPLPAAPPVFQQWMFGETTKIKKPFRIRAITAGSELNRKITALEYNESVYASDGFVVPTPNYSSLSTTVNHVSIDGVSEELVRVGPSILTRVTLTWTPQQESYAGAEVYMTRQPTASPLVYESLGRQRDRVSVFANDNEQLKFMVVAYDSVGRSAPQQSAPTFTHTVVGKTQPPSDVTGLVVTNTINGAVLQWNQVTDLDLRGYEVRLGSDWGTGVVLSQNFSGTQFQDIRRTPGSYTYMVRAVDMVGNYSTGIAQQTLNVAGVADVTGLTGSNTINGPLLNWNPVVSDILKGYEIRLGATWESGQVIVRDLTGNAYFDSRRLPGTYVYHVRTQDIFGGYSGSSATVNVVVEEISTPTGMLADARINDILLTWNAVISQDLKGYEIRLGTAWDSAQVLVTNYGGNSFTDTKRPAGVYTYLVRSIGSLGNYSTGFASYTLTLTPPQTVAGFDCVQNGDRIEFRWDANPEDDLIGYELREGPSWGSGLTVVTLLGTSYSLPAQSISGDRTFWIKAIREPGIESLTAVFSTTAIATPTDRNLIFTSDQAALGFPGNKFNTTVVDGRLQLNAGQMYGEYTFGITLPTTYRARNSLLATFDAIVPDTTTWAGATYQWNSAQAGRGWAISGDSGKVGLQFYIAKYEGLTPGAYTEGFGLNGSTTGEYGTVAASAVNVTYAPARFVQGVLVTDTTTLTWNLAVPAQFNVTFWAKISAIPVSGLQVFWKGFTAGGDWIDLSWNVGTSRFELRDFASNIIQVVAPGGSYQVGDLVCFGIVQTASERRLYVGTVGKGVQQGTAAFTPIGALSSVRLHP